MKNIYSKENIKLGREPSSPLSFSSASPHSKKSKNLEIDYLGELDIKQLTNTRHKHQKHKENINSKNNNNNNNQFLLTKEQKQQQQGVANNQMMQNSYLFKKNQQSPLVYNREAERFSYLCDPMLGQQLQEQSITQQIEQQQQQQQFLRAQQQQYQHMNNQINSQSIYTQDLQQPKQQQFPNSKQAMLASYPQQNQQYVSSEFRQPNWNSYPSPYSNTQQQQQQTCIPYSTQFQQNYPQYQQYQQQQQQLIQPRSINSSLSEEQSRNQEDSFGNTNTNINHRTISNRNYTQQLNTCNPSHNNLETPYIQDQASVLQRYNSKNLVFSTGTNKKTSSRLLLPRINSSTVIFIILAAYVVFKNLSKITGAVETFKALLPGGTRKTNHSSDNKEIPLITGLENSQQQNYSAEQGQQQGSQQQKFDNNLLSEQDKQEKQDAAIAKTFARELIKELFLQLKAKGRVYRADYEDQLSQRFQMHMFREILPEFVDLGSVFEQLNKVLLNSKEIRIQYDVIKRQEYYEFQPEF